MIEPEKLIITFPSAEEKVAFMKWIEDKGFELFMKEPTTMISCMSSCDYAATGLEEDYETEYGLIEMQ